MHSDQSLILRVRSMQRLMEELPIKKRRVGEATKKKSFQKKIVYLCYSIKQDPVLPGSSSQYILTNVRGEELCAVVARSLLVSVFLGHYYIIACSAGRLLV